MNRHSVPVCLLRHPVFGNTPSWTGDIEPFHSFMTRFSSISTRIYNLNPEVTLHSMLMTLKSRSFFDSLCKLPPTEMDDLRTRASSYMQIEVMAEFRDNIRTEN
ncbi:hypothetical protein CR513_44875, partial [Mucuna pruriens]